ncbi:MAG: efflux RND transporter permease subunit [Phycisphaerae bacterium]|nr:efflux RND transporter permease subunit [Phycisphaerae bacterium]
MNTQEPSRTPLTTRIVELFLTGNLSVMLIIVSLLGGAIALMVTPREEDPQIVVPMADVMISVPGASAGEVERQVASQLEKMLFEIDGVEYVYSTSLADAAVVTVRFYVGQDREKSLVKIYNKISMNMDRIPPQVRGWVVKPVEIDDVPVLGVTLYSEKESDFALRRTAEEIESRLKQVDDAGRTYVIGGRPLKMLVRVDPSAATSRGVGFDRLIQALQVADASMPAGAMNTLRADKPAEIVLDAGRTLQSIDEVRNLVVGVNGGLPVYLRDVATVELGPDEPANYARIGFGPKADPARLPEALRGKSAGRDFPAVTIAVAKKKGANAVTVAEGLIDRLHTIDKAILPDGVHYYITRNYGETANDKVNELVEGLAVAIIIVILLIALSLGWRESLIIATAIPITFALTLLVNYWAGYTINRVTLFALILALGLVVDDPIVDVENIHRHFQKPRDGHPWALRRAVLDAVNEVRPPIILATLAVIVSFVPMFFITGMMGPYMRPMALNVPLAMLMSMVVAFTITPWLSYLMLRGHAKGAKPQADSHGGEGTATTVEGSLVYRVYRASLGPFLERRWARWALLGVTMALFVGSGWLAADRQVPLKMLPYDNKNEFQVALDLDRGATLEQTQAAAADLADYLRRVPEVTDVTSYVGVAGPMDFNGMVRHYYLRNGANTGEMRVNVVHKKRREQQSHELTLRLRNDLQTIANTHQARIKIVEMPPGPPVLSTVVAEVYGEPFTPYEELLASAKVVQERLKREAGVVDVDSTVETGQKEFRFVPDREKARLAGVSEQQIALVVQAAVQGADAAILHSANDVNPTPIQLRLPLARRTSVNALNAISVVPKTADPKAKPVQLSELGEWKEGNVDQPIYHKNLQRVVYVTAEMAGRPPAEAVLDVQADMQAWTAKLTDSPARPVTDRTFLSNGANVHWKVPDNVKVTWTGEGEWKITLDVFRDLGIAFALACLGIYILLVYETKSYLMPLILMISIPLTVIGIMPGFWLLNKLGGGSIGGFANPTYFTATAMIGMIALSGIVVRNGILLIDFLHKALAGCPGKPLKQALIESGAVRFRPIFLTAGAAMLAAWPITLDPIFSGLAWALIFGLFVSTAFTLLIVPVVYYMAYARKHQPDSHPGIPKIS